MTPATTGGKRGGNFEIQRTLCGVSIRRSSGTRSVRQFNRLIAVLEKAAENMNVELLRAFARGDVNPAELIDSDRRDEARLTLSNVKLRAYLWDRIVDGDTVPGAVSKGLARVPGAKNRRRYVVAFQALERKAERWLPVDARITALRDVPWDELYEAWGATNADWMHVKRAVSRFLTLHLGDKWDPFARQMRQRIPSKKVKKRRPNVSIEQFKAIVAHAPAHAAASYWVLAVTGVRLEEYLTSTRDRLNRSAFTYTPPGADKNTVGDFPLRIDPRWWPYLEAGIPSRLREGWLRKYWARACEAAGLVGGQQGITLHDLRHCHGQWAVNAGVAESKVQGTLRHEDPRQTRDYVMQAGTADVSTALADAFFGAQTTTPRKRRKA